MRADPDTLGAERLVILAGRTLQSLARLHYDLAPLLAVDHRIKLLYALHGDSDRRDAAEHRAIQLDIPLTPWKRACEARPNLVISASADPGLYEAAAPIALIPHGATYNRIFKGLSGAAGTAREHLVGPDGELPALLAMPGTAAMAQLAADCREALPFAEVTGDLCMERMRISAPMRHAYRETLGIGPEKILVTVSSTWGEYSLTRADRRLPERLLSQLPADEFSVAYIPHPNIDADHGGNLNAWLQPLLRNGLIAVPPEEGWRAVLVASDCVIGDHGTVSFSAYNLGRPVLLGAFGSEEIATGSPQEAFGKAAPQFRTDVDPEGQIRAAIAGPERDREDFLDAAWDESESAAARILDCLYRLMALDPPESWADLTLLPLPENVGSAMSAWHAEVRIDGDAAMVERFPAFRPEHKIGHLVVTESCMSWGLRREARVFLAHGKARTEPAAETIAADLHRAYSGALVSIQVDADRSIVFRSSRERYELRCAPDVLDLAPSVLHAALRAGLSGQSSFNLDGRAIAVERLP